MTLLNLFNDRLIVRFTHEVRCMLRVKIEDIYGRTHDFYTTFNTKKLRDSRYEEIHICDKEGNHKFIMSFNQESLCNISIKVLDAIEEEEEEEFN